MTTIGAVFRPQSRPEDLEQAVRCAEDAGLHELWLWEDCFSEAGVSSAAAALAWSGRLQVGVGLFPAPLRNPALLAMELATLERLFPGRTVATVGHGVAEWMAQVGAAPRSPMTLLREYTVAVRDLLDGRTVDARGEYVSLSDVALDWPPTTRQPLLVGARGPRTVALAGELADGVLLDSVADLAAVRAARASVDESRAASGRPGRAEVAVFQEVDPSAGPGVLGQLVGALASAGADRVVLQATAAAPSPVPLIEALVAAGLLEG